VIVKILSNIIHYLLCTLFCWVAADNTQMFAFAADWGFTDWLWGIIMIDCIIGLCVSQLAKDKED